MKQTFRLATIALATLVAVTPCSAQTATTGSSPSAATSVRAFQDLWIPPLITGKTFDLALGKSSKSLWPGATTHTYGYNDARFWGPTLVFEQGETVRINVKNNLDEPTTVHWHGLHLPAATDGGPHQLIAAGATWSPSFTVRNNAGTYWYHPHPHESTQKQIAMGAGGLIIIRDPIEAKLALPRAYGVDDIPLVLTSRRFNLADQFTFAGDNDKYGDFSLVNGTLDPKVSLPAQFVRLRILNAEIERGYQLGFSDNRKFYLIATDGGLVDKPVPLSRIKLMVGERIEILVDLSGDKPGATVDLMAYNARQPFGFPGGEPGRSPPNGSYLNNLDFRLLRVNVAAPTAAPITKLPPELTRNKFWSEADATERRTLNILRFGPPNREFAFDRKYYDMHTVNHVVKLGAVEAWTIVNDRTFGHSFHIHDVQFKIVARSDGPVPDYEQGWKDSLYIPRGQSATFVTRFDDFASDTDAFMYHCHMANHEDGGLMGQFLVVNDPATLKPDASGVIRLADRARHAITPAMTATADRQVGTAAPPVEATDLAGKPLRLAALAQKRPVVLFFIEKDCPCSRDAAKYFGRLSVQYGQNCSVVGVINADTETARNWVKETGAGFPLIADPKLELINAYRVTSSASSILVAPGGAIEKVFPGYSATILGELSANVARLSGTTPPALSFDAAPKDPTSGCAFSQ
ncbi:multicopper oxidase domain-containing protein [Humisphaera borealis]|uniref:multicopper oxidase domain-containing protein n=1 Tax=Humisphaera borealis TaxID=2807512 RepID=UPI0019D2A253|nr:multicopper oxidase domain-containing protein [Humisphaera borealis]